MNVSVFIALLLIGVIMAPLCSAQNRRMTIRLGEAKAPSPREPQPGDRFHINTDGDIEIEHKDQTGQIERRRIPRRNKVRPQIVVATEITGSQTVRYTYSVSNRIGANQSIDHFAIGAIRPDLIREAFGPARWNRIASPLDHLPRYNWFSPEATTDITPRGGTVQAGFDAPLLPGFMKGYFEGRLSAAEPIVELDGGRLSASLTEKVSDALMYHNNTLQIPIIGPKFEIARMRTSGQLAQAIADELLAAAVMSEFEEHRLFLENTGVYLKTAGKSAAGLSKSLSTMGQSPVQGSFFRAMALNLEYLEKLP